MDSGDGISAGRSRDAARSIAGNSPSTCARRNKRTNSGDNTKARSIAITCFCQLSGESDMQSVLSADRFHNEEAAYEFVEARLAAPLRNTLKEQL